MLLRNDSSTFKIRLLIPTRLSAQDSQTAQVEQLGCSGRTVMRHPRGQNTLQIYSFVFLSHTSLRKTYLSVYLTFIWCVV